MPALWHCDAYPGTVAVHGPLDACPSVAEALRSLPLLVDHGAGDGRYAVLANGGFRHRLLILDGAPTGRPGYLVDWDGPLQIRLAALSALHNWRDAAALPALMRALHPTEYQRYRFDLMLSVLDAMDAHARGQSPLRAAATSLFESDSAGWRAAEWKASSTRRQVQRLVAEARRLAKSGYRDLLNARMH